MIIRNFAPSLRQPDLRLADAAARFDRLEGDVVARLDERERRRRRCREAVGQQVEELAQMLAPRRAKAGRQVGNVAACQVTGQPVERGVAEAARVRRLRRLCCARRSRGRTRRAAPTIRSASSGRCWPSPSRIRTYSPVAARIPLFTAAPLPLLYGMPDDRARRRPRAAPRSCRVEPSSTTMISCHDAAARSVVITPPIASASLIGGDDN